MDREALKMPRDIRLTDVVTLLTQANGPSLHLDFSDFWRADREAAMLLNCALMTRLDRTDLLITPPSHQVLARCGLMFGLAQHRAHTAFIGGPPDAANEAHLSKWRRPWTPGSRQQWLRLSVMHDNSEVEEETATEPSVWNRDVAAFVNPHLAPRVPRATRLSQVARPWLLSLLPPRARVTSDPGAGARFTDDLGGAIDELVDNVGCHAVAAGESASTVRSGVFLLKARGNAGDVRDRIYVAVLDSGPGILTTARPKFSASLSGTSDESLLQALFERKHSQLGRARGFGLPSVLDVARRWRGGSVNCFTDGLHARFSNDRASVSPIGTSVGGTVVMLTLHTPPELADRRDLSDVPPGTQANTRL